MTVDLFKLLEKYINEVGTAEGVDFIPKSRGDTQINPAPYTMEELEVLWKATKWDDKKGCYND